MKITLFNPEVKVDKKIKINDLDIGEHIGLGILAALLRSKGHEAQILYYRQEIMDECISNAANFNPDLVGITLMSQTYPLGMTLIEHLKENLGKPIIIGGILPTILKHYFFDEFDPGKYVDFLIFGDGEGPLIQLVETLDKFKYKDRSHIDFSGIPGLVWRSGGKTITNSPCPFLGNLDEIPLPARDYAPQVITSLNQMGARPALRIITSRGCLGTCLFCHIHEYYYVCNKKPFWRFRSPQNVINEIKYLKDQYNVEHFLLSDDNFLGYGSIGWQRARTFAKLLLKEKLHVNFSIQARLNSFDLKVFTLLKDAGLISIDFGIETINPNSLKFLKKNITLNGMLRTLEKISQLKGIAYGFYMLNIHPLSTVEETMHNFSFLKEVGYFEGKNTDKEIFRKLIASCLEITKYTRMYYKIKAIGLLSKPFPNNPIMFQFVFKDENMTRFYNDIIRNVEKHELNHFSDFFLDLSGKYSKKKLKIN